MLLLISLFFCHYIADFQLTTYSMLEAKRHGVPSLPLLAHSAIHGMLVALCVIIAGVSWKMCIGLFLLEFVSHFLIDTTRGLLVDAIPMFADYKRKGYWQLLGFGQFLHILVIILIFAIVMRQVPLIF